MNDAYNHIKDHVYSNALNFCHGLLTVLVVAITMSKEKCLLIALQIRMYITSQAFIGMTDQYVRNSSVCKWHCRSVCA